MSQFDFPRVNFHGTALLDTSTANNGNYEPLLTVFDQDESLPFLPPRCYLAGATCTPPPGVNIIVDKNGNSYVPITPINADNYQAWATTPLGSFAADAAFAEFYSCLGVTGNIPGYWNYYGDLSMALQDVTVTGITIPDTTNGTVTFTPQNAQGCPAGLAGMLGAEFSFNNNYFGPNSRTTAYLSDVDSVGQMCTQIFYGTAGLYQSSGGSNVTFFTGTPVKGTAKWMNLSRVLNWTNMVPMGGSASFYSMIELTPGSQIAQVFQQYTGSPVTCLFMKLLIHEVYEVRNPDYSQIPTKTFNSGNGNPVQIPKNPATVSITGSITPWMPGDMKTTSLCRILKSAGQITIDTTGIPNPVPNGSTTPIGIPAAVNLASAHFVTDSANNIISIDLINTINEYGINYGPLPVFAGIGDIPPFENFLNYNYGTFSLYFQPDAGGAPLLVGNITYDDNYNMEQFLATGGMVDLPLTGGDYSGGSFYLTLGAQTVMQEDNVYITTDQQGIYAEQNQYPVNLYMSDGLPLVPCTLRVLYRGKPVIQQNAVTITLQCINMISGIINNITGIQVYDQQQYVFPVNTDGCITYAFSYDDPLMVFAPPVVPKLTAFAMRAYLVVVRVLSSEPQLQPYISGQLPITWQVVFDNVLVLYKTIYPVMDAILPINESNWSEPYIQAMVLQFTNESNWNQPLYMPVTRDLSGPQRLLLQQWINQSNTN